MKKVNSKKKIDLFFFTGKRGGFSHLVPIIKILDKQKSINYKILVTDMHLSSLFGKTLNEIKKYSKKIILLDSIQIKDTIANRLQVISKIQALSKIFKKKTNFYFYWVIGPRFLVLQLQLHIAIYLSFIYTGGFNTGGTDEATRHAISNYQISIWI